MSPVDESQSNRLGEAVTLAAQLHDGQTRKGTEIPYLSHLLAVAALVAEDRGDDDTVCAALLHDAAEDRGGEPTLRRISEVLGDQVSQIVRECSDAMPEPGVEKPPWRERKEAMIARLQTLSGAALLIVAADKLHNVRSTLFDLMNVGGDVWMRFKTGRDGFVWYHEQMATALEQFIPGSRSVKLLREDLKKL
jgi:GTP pyrophosphokinase